MASAAVSGVRSATDAAYLLRVYICPLLHICDICAVASQLQICGNGQTKRLVSNHFETSFAYTIPAVPLKLRAKARRFQTPTSPRH